MPGSERIDLPSFPGVYLLVDPEIELDRTHAAFRGESAYKRRGYSPGRGDRARAVHVISSHAGGEIRGYFWIGARLHLRTPAYPHEWPEVDHATATALSVSEVIT